jgi:hypothetical protein
MSQTVVLRRRRIIARKDKRTKTVAATVREALVCMVAEGKERLELMI